ncbi:MAG: MotA/TolQ/ExbB proton channel family protein [Verrucomicrobiae bacterium]|nr:MotA/TolQ/ExbB proton channel family protein [Verrucomicrobiae bacterium]
MVKTKEHHLPCDDAGSWHKIKRIPKRIYPIISFLIFFSSLFQLLAQPAELSHVSQKTFREVWQQGGPVMYLLALASIFTIALVVEGFFLLRFKKLCPPEQIQNSKTLILQNRFQELWNQCQEHPSYLSALLKAALSRLGRGHDVVEHATQMAALRQATLLKSRISYLSAIGVVTPMIGLTGTVIGMIKAFAVLGSAGIADPGALSARIAEVLTATAGGLVIAIPAFIFFYLLKNRLITVLTLADATINDLIDLIPLEIMNHAKTEFTFSA